MGEIPNERMFQVSPDHLAATRAVAVDSQGLGWVGSLAGRERRLRA